MHDDRSGIRVLAGGRGLDAVDLHLGEHLQIVGLADMEARHVGDDGADAQDRAGGVVVGEGVRLVGACLNAEGLQAAPSSSCADATRVFIPTLALSTVS